MIFVASNGIEKTIKKAVECQDWSDLFKYTMYLVKNDIKCHSLAFFDSIEEPYDENKGYGIAKMKPFPLIENQETYFLRCYFFKESTNELFFGKTDGEFSTSPQKIFLIAFMDYNFKANLDTNHPIKTSDTSVHDMSFGILIDTL